MTGQAVTAITTRYYPDGSRRGMVTTDSTTVYRQENGPRWATICPEGDGTATVVLYDTPHYCSGPERLRAAWAHKRAQKWVGW